MDEVIDGDDVTSRVPADVHIRTENEIQVQLCEDERRGAGDDEKRRERPRFEPPGAVWGLRDRFVLSEVVESMARGDQSSGGRPSG